ncbi:entry exclusion lipoprotein TrbK [Pseudoduganella flava]|uniref:Entry exclusion lipoprotein TrbK n=1 Tax=Pseudoduganella flava TaxID=871742 RepID=A0ABX6FYP7_9BURK|nr:entry exclusion lipoprotein TrbK [Pseudoduganella flava]QGZ42629.1 entry exclusion lipoprotein TrbK [Pseudoduganella flava]
MKRTNLIIGVVAAGVIAAFAWRSVSRVPAQPVRAPVAAECTQEAIRAVGDAVERSILAAQCRHQH